MLAIADISSAQRKYSKTRRKIQEISFGTGATNFLGELGGANKIGSNKISIRDFDFQSIRPNINVGYRYQYHKNWALKAELNMAYIGGKDALTEERYRENRNLSFRSPIVELSVREEYIMNLSQKGHRYNFKGIKGWKNYILSPYFFAGVGVFWFDPYGKINDQWYRLKPMSTEGQGLVPTREVYSSYQLVLPYGIGFRYAIDKSWTIGLEYGLRWTFTDYIDDVSTTYFDAEELARARGLLAVELANPSPSATDPTDPLYRSTLPGQQRGDPRDKDTYMFALLSLYYNLDKGFIPKLKF